MCESPFALFCDWEESGAVWAAAVPTARNAVKVHARMLDFRALRLRVRCRMLVISAKSPPLSPDDKVWWVDSDSGCNRLCFSGIAVSGCPGAGRALYHQGYNQEA